MKHRWLRFASIAFFLLMCSAGVLVVYVRIKEKQQVPTVYEVAEKLGYSPQAQLAQTRRCWDIFAHCGVFLYFTTELSLDEFQTQVMQLGFSQKRFGDIDGYTIFTDINLGTNRLLTANGNDGLENRFSLPEPDAHEWHLTDKQGRRWVIAHYEVTATGIQYAIDGQDVHGNIVSLMLQTK
jgi:hypothetical protein